MKITRLLTATDENPTYIQFVPLVTKAWKKLTGLETDIAFVSDRDNDDPLVRRLSEFGHVHLYKPLKIDRGIQAKISRMAMATEPEFTDENCSIIDIDMLPLTRRVIDVFRDAPDDHLIKWGWDHPAFAAGSDDYGKWPMDRTTARGTTFQQIINPQHLGYQDLIHSWFNYHYIGKEAVNRLFNQFSDESLLRALYEKWPDKTTRTTLLARSLLNSHSFGRIDRSLVEQYPLLPKIQDGTFYECHGIRPFLENIEYYREIITYLGLDKEDIIL